MLLHILSVKLLAHSKSIGALVFGSNGSVDTKKFENTKIEKKIDKKDADYR